MIAVYLQGSRRVRALRDDSISTLETTGNACPGVVQSKNTVRTTNVRFSTYEPANAGHEVHHV